MEVQDYFKYLVQDILDGNAPAEVLTSACGWPSDGALQLCLLCWIPQEQPDYNRFPNSFSHIFAGGYAAGYYSYKWAEVLSSDAFSLFEETGVLNPETGKKWLIEVLAVGSSRPAMDSFIAFRGRAPKIDALLRHSGIKPIAK